MIGALVWLNFLLGFLLSPTLAPQGLNATIVSLTTSVYIATLVYSRALIASKADEPMTVPSNEEHHVALSQVLERPFYEVPPSILKPASL